MFINEKVEKVEELYDISIFFFLQNLNKCNDR